MLVGWAIKGKHHLISYIKACFFKYSVNLEVNRTLYNPAAAKPSITQAKQPVQDSRKPFGWYQSNRVIFYIFFVMLLKHYFIKTFFGSARILCSFISQLGDKLAKIRLYIWKCNKWLYNWLCYAMKGSHVLWPHIRVYVPKFLVLVFAICARYYGSLFCLLSLSVCIGFYCFFSRGF